MPFCFWPGAISWGFRRRTHVAAVSGITFGAMALGAAALVLTLALLEGFQYTIRRQLTEGAASTPELRPRSRYQPARRRLAASACGRRTRSSELRALSGRCRLVHSSDSEASAGRAEVVDTLSRVEVNRVLAARLGAGAGSESPWPARGWC